MSTLSEVRFLERSSPPHIVTLVAVAAFGPVMMNLFLPALPAIASYFNTQFAVVQFAVSLYLAATAFLQLLIGPLSDLYGRRPVLIGCIVLSLAATLAGIYAPTIEIFLAARIIQGSAIAGMVISRAAIRDMVATDEAASRIGYVTMAMTLAPMVGPIVGGYLAEIYGWQATFWLVFAFGLATLALTWADLGETNRSRGGGFGTQFAAYPHLFKSRRFWGYSMSAALASGAFFAFLGGGPYLAVEYYNIPPSHFGYYFTFMGIGYLVGNFFTGRYSRRFGVNTMMMIGGIVASIGMVIAFLAQFAGWHHPMELYLPTSAIGLGNGILLPNAVAGMVGVRPHLAGSASGLGGFLQIGGGAILSVVGGAIIGPGTGPMPLILLMLASSLLSIVVTLYVVTVARQVAQADPEPPDQELPHM